MMATAGSYLQSAEEDLICPLCLELFIDPHTPKLLDCPHVYCQQCLNKMLGKKQTISCPECRKNTRIPDRDVTNLKTILRLRSLAEKHEKHTEQQTHRHKQQSSASGAKTKCMTKVPFCKEHDGEKLHFYCLTCQVTVCQACLVLNHERPKHNIKSVKDVHIEKIQILEATVQRNEKLISDFRKNVKHVTYCEQKVYACIKQSDEDIDVATALAISTVEKQAQKLKQDVRDNNSHMLKKCQKQKEDCHKKADELQSIVDDAKKVLEIRTSHEYLKRHTQVTKQIIAFESDRKAKMPIAKENDFDYRLHDLEYDFESNALCLASYGFNEQLLGINMGAVQCRIVRKIKLCQTYALSHPIASIACGSSLVVVSMQNQKQIQVYEQNSEKLTKHKCYLVPTEKNWHPFDVAVMKSGKILVARWNCVDVFSFSGKHERSISMNRDPVYESATTSVTTTEDGHILIGDYHRCCIERYSSDGKQRENELSSTCFWNVTAIGNKYIAASDLENKVCIYSQTKDFAQTESRCYSCINIPNPTALCYDKETQCLLIGRKDAEQDAEDGAVIEQYCWQTGAKIATLARGLKDPQDMAFTDDGMLAVADDKTIKFYKVSAETTDIEGRLWNSFNSIFQPPELD